jgi:hypothetical protein
MKSYTCLLIVIFTLLSAISCKKNNATAQGTAALTVINAVVGSAPLITNFSGSYQLNYSMAQKLSYGSYNATVNEFSAYDGTARLALYQIPDTTDHSIPLYNLNLKLPVKTIHTLFLTGKVATPDSLLLTDNPPYHTASDSSMGIRFVNLSAGSVPVNVTLSTTTTMSEFSNIAYKGSTDFKNYPTIRVISSYTFQVRNASTNAVISSFTFSGINNGTGSNLSNNNYRFRNFTLALIGQPGGTGSASQKLLLINNY